MNEAFSAVVDTVAEVFLVRSPYPLIPKYKADGIPLAYSLTSDLTFLTLLFIVYAEVIGTSNISLISFRHSYHLLLRTTLFPYSLKESHLPLQLVLGHLLGAGCVKDESAIVIYLNVVISALDYGIAFVMHHCGFIRFFHL